eukprot:13245787-Alexandrium_andersonii.AAC.1
MPAALAPATPVPAALAAAARAPAAVAGAGWAPAALVPAAPCLRTARKVPEGLVAAVIPED